MAIELFKLNETNEYESIFAFPKIGICNFMRTIYKRYFYEQMSEYSNLPHFDTCPVPGGQYEIKQFPFDMETFKRYKQLIEPGSYRLQNFLVHKNVAVSGIQFYGRVVENIWKVVNSFRNILFLNFPKHISFHSLWLLVNFTSTK